MKDNEIQTCVPGKIIKIVMGREIISTHEYRNNYTHLTRNCLTGRMTLLDYLIVTINEDRFILCCFRNDNERQ